MHVWSLFLGWCGVKSTRDLHSTDADEISLKFPLFLYLWEETLCLDNLLCERFVPFQTLICFV